MPDSTILVDFGASRVKCVQWSFADQCVTASVECASPKARHGKAGEVEFEPEAYWTVFLETVGKLAQQAPEVEDIWLCTEMHGFMLVEADSATPLTPYISWQDQRASFSDAHARSTLDDLQTQATDFLHHTGMRLRAGLPGLNLSHLARQGSLPRTARFATLADWLLLRGGEGAPQCHPTLAASTGLYSLVERDWFPALVATSAADLSGIQFPRIHEPGQPIGQVRLAGRLLRVWGGIGDLQAAAHGGTFPQRSDILINLGTGSQVLTITQQPVPGVDSRPGAAGQHFHAVTHIPSGRALNVFASFLDECAALGGGQAFFWRLFSELDAREVLQASPSVDLNVFEAAWKYVGGGFIAGIQEHQFLPCPLILSIARSWLQQYVDALASMDPQHPSATFLLTGGLSRRAAFIPAVLEQLLQRHCIMPELRTGEDTLDGLLRLAEQQRSAHQPAPSTFHTPLQ